MLLMQTVTLAKLKADCRSLPDAENLIKTEGGWGDDITVDLSANVLQKLNPEEIARYHEVEDIDGYSWC